MRAGGEGDGWGGGGVLGLDGLVEEGRLVLNNDANNVG